jgi:hypothetical protein
VSAHINPRRFGVKVAVTAGNGKQQKSNNVKDFLRDTPDGYWV